ncbi:MAG: hypothetical protein AB1607_10385 [Chloroflexota bacterium]
MKAKLTTALLVISGSVIGYSIAVEAGATGWAILHEMLMGAGVGLCFDVALTHKEYGMFLGSVIALLVSVSVDITAGSPLDLRDKLTFMLLGSFVGWGYRWGRAYWIPVLVGGFIGGMFGFWLGFNRSHWFGQICLLPGFLNAGLTFVNFSILGMGICSLYLKSFGWRYMERRLQER